MSSNRSHTHELLAARFALAARAAFAALLITSPLSLQWTPVARPIGYVFSIYTDVRLYLTDLFLLLTLLLWFVSLIVRPRRLRLGPWFLTLPIVALVELSWVGVFTGIDPFLTRYHSIRFTILFGLYLWLVNENPPPRWIAIPLALGLVAQTGVALAQFVAQRPIGLSWLGELAPDPRVVGASIVRVGDVRVLRAYGLTEHPNVLGGFIAFALVLLLGHYLATSSRLRPRVRYVWLVPLALGGVGLLVTFSRAAALGLVGGGLLLTLALLVNTYTRRRYLKDLTVAALVSGTVLLWPTLANQSALTQRVGQASSFVENVGEQRSLAERGALMESAARIFFQHEWTGVGNGALPEAMYRLDSQFDKQYFFQPAHLVLLDAAAELGFLGGFLWLWLLTVPWFALWVKRREVIASPWAMAIAAALLVINIIGFFDYYPWLLEPGRIWQWSAWGLVGAAWQSRGQIT